MMLLGTLILIGSAGILTGCAGPQYEQDYKPDTNFSAYESYTWDSSRSEIPGVHSNRLRQLTQQALSAQGLVANEETPDLRVSISGFTRQARGGSKGVGLSIGVPLGGSGRIGVGGSKSLDSEKEEGVLIMDVTDAQSNDLLWRGTATGIPLTQFRLDEEERLKETIEELVAQFPPE